MLAKVECMLFVCGIVANKHSEEHEHLAARACLDVAVALARSVSN